MATLLAGALLLLLRGRLSGGSRAVRGPISDEALATGARRHAGPADVRVPAVTT
jgi:hypothetical protein